jgi:hypothetical protein
MQRRKLLFIGPALVAVGARVHAQGDKAAKQSEVKDKAMQALRTSTRPTPSSRMLSPGAGLRRVHDLWPELRPGRRGGKGIAHDNKTPATPT